jgi:hypothetical protein
MSMCLSLGGYVGCMADFVGSKGEIESGERENKYIPVKKDTKAIKENGEEEGDEDADEADENVCQSLFLTLFKS